MDPLADFLGVLKAWMIFDRVLDVEATRTLAIGVSPDDDRETTRSGVLGFISMSPSVMILSSMSFTDVLDNSLHGTTKMI